MSIQSMQLVVAKLQIHHTNSGHWKVAVYSIIVKPPEVVLEVYVVNFKKFPWRGGGHAPAPPEIKEILYKNLRCTLLYHYSHYLSLCTFLHYHPYLTFQFFLLPYTF